MIVFLGTFKLADYHGTRFGFVGGNARQRRCQVRAWKRQGYQVKNAIWFNPPPRNPR